MKRTMKKQFLVLGLGRFGASVAESLCRMGHEVLAVDSAEDRVAEVAPHVTQAVQADVTDEAALDALGRDYDAAVVAIGTDVRASVLVTVLCKERGIPCVIAKAVDELHARVLRKVGADRVVFPERDMGERVAKSMVMPNILDMAELSGEYRLAEVRVPAAWAGKTLVEVNVRRNFGVSVLAIHRGETFMASPGAEACFQAEDVLLVLGRQQEIDAINT